jgi:protein-L-isoaspartate(D-aspartate) O-methyltransferase
VKRESAGAEENPESTVPSVAEQTPELLRGARRAEREAMVRTQIEARGVADVQVLEAMRAVPRELFVPEALRDRAYGDGPLPIGHDVTISQPVIVASMTELADVDAGSRVLEVGTGSGYQSAILAELGAKVYSIEIIDPLSRRARTVLDELGYNEVETRVGDGYEGWPEQAPFDAIIVTAAPPRVPEPLKKQLAVGGKLVIPVGRLSQDLLVITRTHDGYRESNAYPVRFVPMTGKAQERH